MELYIIQKDLKENILTSESKQAVLMPSGIMSLGHTVAKNSKKLSTLKVKEFTRTKHFWNHF